MLTYQNYSFNFLKTKKHSNILYYFETINAVLSVHEDGITADAQQHSNLLLY